MASQINRVLWTNLVDDYYAINILTLLADGTVDMHLYNRDFLLISLLKRQLH